MLVEGLVSTIIPVHNRPALLREAVASVLAQTYRPVEIIIVDDGSTDETGREAEALAEAHSEVRAIHRQNGGPGAARETGRLAARGEFIQYLDSDDLLLPTKFELQVAGLRQYRDCAVSYGKTRFYAIGERPTDVPWKRTGERISTMFPSFLQSRWWGTSTPLYRRDVTDLAGPWTELRNEEDWEYDCRIARNGGRLHYCDVFVSDERVTLGHHLSTAGSSDPEKLRRPSRCTQADFGTRVCGANLSRDLRDAALCSRTFPVSASVWCGGAWRRSADTVRTGAAGLGN